MKMSKQETIKYLHVVSMVMVCIIAIIVFYVFQIQKYDYYNKEIKCLKDAVKKLNQVQKNKSEFDNKKNKILTSLNVLNEKIPVKPLIPQAIEEITKPMDEFGVSLISITPLDSIKKGSQSSGVVDSSATMDMGVSMPEMNDMSQNITDISNISGESYMETPIELIVHATYKQFGMYLNALRHLNRLIVIDGFEIESDKTITPKLNIKLKLSVFHYAKE